MSFKKSLLLIMVMVAGVLIVGSLVAQDDDDGDDMMMDPGLVTVQSELSFDDTVASAEQILEAEGFGIPLVLDHQANAGRVDLELLPTTLIVFGNPMVGTSLMQESRSMAIDLPQKFLIWEDENGDVFITFNDPLYLANRHGVVEQDEKLGNIANRLQSLAEMIGTTEPMMDDMNDSDEGEEDSD